MPRSNVNSRLIHNTICYGTEVAPLQYKRVQYLLSFVPSSSRFVPSWDRRNRFQPIHKC